MCAFVMADPLGSPDPLFNVDVGFYLFHLPFYELLQDGMVALALITLLAVSVFHAYFGLLRFSRNRQKEDWRGRGRSTPVLPVFCPRGQLGMGVLPRSRPTPLFDSGSRLRCRLYGRSFHAGRLLGHDGGRGGAMHASVI